MENKDEKLWKMAEARVKFKGHLTTYLTVNLFVWILWYFTGRVGSNYADVFLPWPAWMTIGWGIGLVINFFGVYLNNNFYSVDREYRNLKRNE